MASDRLRVLVVDDERPARRKVKMLLEADPEVQVVFEAPDAQSALHIVRDERPDLMFVDVRMPGMDGLELVTRLAPDVAPHVVFVTAFDEHALQAFDLHALDYLLKPFDPPRFARALARAKEAVRQRDAVSEAAVLRRALADARALSTRSGAPLERLLAEERDRTVLLRLGDVERIESDRNYVRLHVGDRVCRTRVTITELEARVDARRFARVSRGTIVNLDHVLSLEPAGHGDALVRLRSGATVRLSRRYRGRLIGDISHSE